MSALLQIEKLNVSMGVQHILHDVSLDLPPRGILAVLGSNGVGKTTLMRAISGIYSPGSGRIRFEGEDITGWPSHRIVDAGICQAPEGRQIFSSMTIRENLLLGGGPHAMGEIDHVVSLFPVLGERMSQKAGSMSGGEQQMLCIGRALMRRPKVLLLDEPSLGLAPMLVRTIFDLVERIREEAIAVLIVEQNVKSALRIADRGAVMDDGRIVLEGTAEALGQDPRVTETYLGGHVAE